MTAPSTPLTDIRLVFSITKGRRERFDFLTRTNGQRARAVEVRLMVLNGTEWRPTPHAFRHRADLAAGFAAAYAAVAASTIGRHHG